MPIIYNVSGAYSEQIIGTKLFAGEKESEERLSAHKQWLNAAQLAEHRKQSRIWVGIEQQVWALSDRSWTYNKNKSDCSNSIVFAWYEGKIRGKIRLCSNNFKHLSNISMQIYEDNNIIIFIILNISKATCILFF